MTRKKLHRSDCERCGRSPVGGWARVLQTGRCVCAWCYDELPFGTENMVIDDGVARTWQETRALRIAKTQLKHRQKTPSKDA